MDIGFHGIDQSVTTIDISLFPVLTMHRRYLSWLLLLGCITLLPAIALNVILLRNEGDIKAMSFAASDWQEQTHGITFTPTLGNNGFFKTLRLNSRLPEIDTVIFGASTAMTIDNDMLPKGWRLYNFTQSGSPVRDSIAQAEYLLQHAPQIKHYIIMIDWAIDYVYEPEDPPVLDLKRADRTQVLAQKQPSPTLAILQEAVSYPRMSKLWQIFRSVMRSSDPTDAFRQYFLQLGSDEYLCPDGKSRGKDFGVYNRGACNGFRYDGSATFSDYTRVENVSALIIGATSSSSMYAKALQHTRGIPDQKLLDRLAAINNKLATAGGQLILIMPPLVPNMEQVLLHNPQLGHYLMQTKKSLSDWASSQRIVLSDFGQSERYGCHADEFLDPHHATQSCYQKIFSSYWQDAQRPDKTAAIPRK
ncbi:MAG: hypothetical protein HYZ46_08850 [Nitrosomonadales bacterium]|nr:hypothetical protein [Nitrosomonadales bacterium]